MLDSIEVPIFDMDWVEFHQTEAKMETRRNIWAVSSDGKCESMPDAGHNLFDDSEIFGRHIWRTR